MPDSRARAGEPPPRAGSSDSESEQVTTETTSESGAGDTRLRRSASRPDGVFLTEPPPPAPPAVSQASAAARRQHKKRRQSGSRAEPERTRSSTESVLRSEHSDANTTDDLSLGTSSSTRYNSEAASELEHGDRSWSSYYAQRSPLFYYRPPAPLPPPSYYSLPTSRAQTPERRSKTPQPASATADDPEPPVSRRPTSQRQGRQRDLLNRREKFRRSKSRERSLERRWADPCGPCPCCEQGGSDEEDWMPHYWHGFHGRPCAHRAPPPPPPPLDHRYSYSGPLDCWPPPYPPVDYHRWLAPYKPGLEYDERLQKLESDKSSLQLQVSVLTEQIDAQTEKISELEDQLRTRQMLLGKAEDRLQKDLALQQELLQRSSFETQKLEVMNKMSNLTLQQKTLERENIELRNRLRRAEMANRLPASPSEAERSRIREKPPTVPRGGAFPAATSTPNHSLVDSPQRANSSASTTDGSRYTSALDSPASNNTATYREGSLPKTPPSSHRRRVESLGGTLPRVSSAGPSSAGGGGAHGDGQRRAVAFADTDQTSGHGTAEDGVSGPPSPSAQPKNKGFKKLFGRMKRSNSGSLEADIPDGGEFRRGGTRATAGPRLGWSGEKSREDDRLWRPLSEWDTDTVVAWFHEMGLSAYTAEARRWVRSGSHLLRATPAELEKELGLKHPLHRKKVVLALRAAGSSADDPPGHIDHNFVMRWLDDVGLPQYKDAFLEARVDGRVLNQLTLDDLHTLKVTNLLHALSLKRGIQVLRSNGFSPACLRRRSTPDEPRQPAPHEVALWTNHRVMEWLREVDLAEYAPNMRGSGVHGALLVHEPRFTGELMASVLSIPASKSLLRRHLFTRFNELVGADILREKRDVEDNQSIPPLRPDSKVKLHKRGQFTLKRRKGKEQLEAEDFLCPLDTQSSPLPSPEVSTNQAPLEMSLVELRTSDV
ncbi:liprin-beta-1-like isoform X3 [Amphibalanus amphitrite]|uniref:liprin-beta-1-like isoform X3 n=1 Tax=Amphibalanus amphitrite TaxID=1232801 RepID=UPI001C914075|nr:liprin-beta-1-like isoform X3 [Amphibalanus amphitrite]